MVSKQIFCDFLAGNIVLAREGVPIIQKCTLNLVGGEKNPDPSVQVLQAHRDAFGLPTLR